MNSQTYIDLVRYLSTSLYRDSTTKDEKRKLRIQAKHFNVSKDDRLYYIGSAKQVKYLRVVREYEVSGILSEIHAGIGGSHFGESNTFRKLSERFWWKGMIVATDLYLLPQNISRATLKRGPYDAAGVIADGILEMGFSMIKGVNFAIN